jgi:hypothetical protein
MLISAIVLAGALAPGPQFQSSQPKKVPAEKLHRELPMPTSQTVAAGGGIFFDFSFEYRQFDSDPGFLDYIACTNSCRGNKHADHVQCDPSCDDICTTKHDVTVEPYVEEKGAFPQWLTRYFRMAEGTKKDGFYPRRGRGSAAKVMDHMRRVSTDYLTRKGKRMDLASATFSAAHWNEDPCSTSSKKITGFEYYLYFKYTIRDAFETLTSGEDLFARIILPNKELGEASYYGNCKCSGLSAWSAGRLGDLFLPSPKGDDKTTRTRPRTGTTPEPKEEKSTRTSGLFIGGDEGLRVATANDMSEFGIEVAALGMNQVQLTVTNTMDHGLSLGLTPGSLLVPDDDRYQEIVVAAPLQLMFAANETIYATLDLETPTSAADGFALCAEMDKRPPDGKVGYSVQAARDDRRVDIALVTSGSFFRGPWHQAMMWIYSDAATLEDINKRITPEVSGRRYLNALYDLSERCLVDLTDKKYKDCLDPSLLDTLGARPEAVTWLLEHADEKELKRWADKAKSKTREWAKGDEEAQAHLATVIAGLGNRPDKDIRRAAANLLLGEPKEDIEKLVDAGALDGIAALLMSDSDKAVDAALDLFEKAPTQFCWSFLQALHEDASRKNKERAAKLLEQLESGDPDFR